MGINNWLQKRVDNYFDKDIMSSRKHWCDFDKICHEIVPADVILVEGRQRISRTIRNITNSPWTHAALYIGRVYSIVDPKLRSKIQTYYKGRPEEQLLVECLPGKGTIVAPLSNYRGEHLRICRPQGLTKQDTDKVIAFAVEHIGNKYDNRQIVDLARFLMDSRFIPGRWKSSLFNYRRGASKKEICSTMIAEAFASVKFPVLPIIDTESNIIYQRNPRLFAPRDFDYSPYFSIIKYPMYPTNRPPYQNLPWDPTDTIINTDK